MSLSSYPLDVIVFSIYSRVMRVIRADDDVDSGGPLVPARANWETP
jgi:hypothetical protein